MYSVKTHTPTRIYTQTTQSPSFRHYPSVINRECETEKDFLLSLLPVHNVNNSFTRWLTFFHEKNATLIDNIPVNVNLYLYQMSSHCVRISPTNSITHTFMFIHHLSIHINMEPKLTLMKYINTGTYILSNFNSMHLW